jgi:hypothetical protein
MKNVVSLPIGSRNVLSRSRKLTDIFSLGVELTLELIQAYQQPEAAIVIVV